MLGNETLSVGGIEISLTGSNDIDKCLRLPLEVKDEIAREVISAATSEFKNVFVLFDGSRETLAVLHLVRQTYNSKIPFTVLHVDTSARFDEVYRYIDKMRKLWGLDLITVRNEEALRKVTIAENREHCCGLLKADALSHAVEKFGIDCLVTAAMYEQGKTDAFVSEKGDRAEVNPLLFHTESDILNCIKKANLTCCSLYDKGYGQIDCKPCTAPPQETDTTGEDRAEIKKKLEALGYLG